MIQLGKSWKEHCVYGKRKESYENNKVLSYSVVANDSIIRDIAIQDDVVELSHETRYDCRNRQRKTIPEHRSNVTANFQFLPIRIGQPLVDGKHEQYSNQPSHESCKREPSDCTKSA